MSHPGLVLSAQVEQAHANRQAGVSKPAQALAGLLTLPAGLATDTHFEKMAREVCLLLGGVAQARLRCKVQDWPQLSEEAEDLCQLAALAFIEAYRQGRIRPDDAAGKHTAESVQAYLWGICNRLFLQAVRRSQARPRVDSAADTTAVSAQKLGSFEEFLSGGPQDDDESRLWEVLAAVASRCRPEDIIVTWLHGCGFSIAELQRLLQISRNVPANALKRVGRALRELLGLDSGGKPVESKSKPADSLRQPQPETPFGLLQQQRFSELLDSLANPATRTLLLRDAAAQLGPLPGRAAAGLEAGIAARQHSVRAAGDWSWGLLSAKERRALLARDAVLLKGAGIPDGGVAQHVALKKLVGDMASIFGELDEALLGDDLEWLLPLAEHIYPILEISSQFKEMRERYRLLLDVAQRLSNPRLELLAQLGLCRAQWRLGDYDGARLSGQAARELALRLGDRTAEALSLNGLGVVEWYQGVFSAARELHEQALAIRRSIGDRHGEANSLINLGVVDIGLSNFSAAREFIEVALAIKRSLGDRYGEAYCLLNMAIVAYGQENYISARELLGQSLIIHRELGDRHGEAFCIQTNAVLDYVQGDYVSARELYGEAQAIKFDLGEQVEEFHYFWCISQVELMQGKLGPARDLYARAFTHYKKLGDKMTHARFCAECGAVLAALGCLRPAVLAMHGALAIAVELDFKMPPDSKLVIDYGLARLDAAVAAGEISAEELAQWKAEGEAMSLDELAEFTLVALAEAGAETGASPKTPDIGNEPQADTN